MNKVQSGILQKVVAINIIVPFIMFMYNQIILNIYNPYTAIPVTSRYSDTVFSNIFMFVYLGLGIPAAVLIGFFLRPVVKALKDSSHIPEAKKRIIRLPWVVIVIYILGFLSGPIIAYIIPSNVKLNEFIFVFPVSFFGGFYAVSFSLILTDRILFRIKKLWGMHILSEEQKEIPLRVKFLLAVISCSGLIYAVTQNIGYFYYKRGINADTGPIFTNMAVHAGILILFGILQVFLITGNLTSMIRYMRESLESIIQGKGNLTKRINIISYDEIGLLTSDFNRMLEFLNNMISRIKNISVNMNESQNILMQSVENNKMLFDGFIDSINKIMDEIKAEFSQTVKLDDSVRKTLESSNLIRNSVDKQMSAVEFSASSTQQIVKSTESVNSITQSLKKSVKGLLENIDQGKSSVQKSIESIQLIQNSSSSLLELNKTISDVSERIKILSINASIEAASAGKSGQGFAVVAKEVKKLSESSTQSVKNIDLNIRETMNRIKEGTGLIVDTAKILESVFSKIEIFIGSLENISSAMEEQDTGTKTIIRAAGDVKQQSMSLLELAEQGEASSNQMKSIAVELVSTSNRITSLTEAQRSKNESLIEMNLNLTKISSTLQSSFEEMRKILSEFIINE